MSPASGGMPKVESELKLMKPQKGAEVKIADLFDYPCGLGYIVRDDPTEDYVY